MEELINQESSRDYRQFSPLENVIDFWTLDYEQAPFYKMAPGITEFMDTRI